LRKANILLVLCFLFFINTYAQKEAANWYFGGGAGLDFNSGTPVIDNDGDFFFSEGCATISDANGNLLFYTDGKFVYNRTHLTMPNGRYIGGHESSTNSGVIVPMPGAPNRYYIFTIYKEGGGLGYREVDLTLDGGLGDIVGEYEPLEAHVTEKLTAVLHANRESYWAVSHRWPGNEFLAYHITSAGINPTPVVSAIGTNIGNLGIRGTIGAMKISPDGSKLAVANQGLGEFQLFDFNSATGEVSNPITLPVTDNFGFGPYGVEFSPNSKVLYGSGERGVVYQYDISSSDPVQIQNSRYKVSQNELYLGAIQLAVDGKIYVSRQSPYIDVINDPDALGTDCNYEDSAIFLGQAYATLGLPVFVQTYFMTTVNAQNFCLGDDTEFHINSSDPIVSVLWDFGDGETATGESVVHRYSTAGIYTISVTTQTTIETKIETKEITITTPPVANDLMDEVSCVAEGETYLFDLTSKDTEALGGQSPADYRVSYYSTATDAINARRPLVNPYHPSQSNETIYVRVEAIANLSCYAINSFKIIQKASPEVFPVEDWVICNAVYNETHEFDLSQKDAEVLNGQDAATFEVLYFESQADADAGTNVIGPLYTNISQQQEIFFRIENKVHPECYETGSFNVEVYRVLQLNEPSYYEVCDTDNDGYYTFDLTTRYPEMLSDNNTYPTTISFYETIEDMYARTNALDPKAYTNTIAYKQTIWARMEIKDQPICKKWEDLVLIVHDSPQVGEVTDWAVCDDNNDGTHLFDLTEKDSEILNGQLASDFDVSYYETLEDAETGQNAVVAPYSNPSNPQHIYFRVENTDSGICHTTGSFELKVTNTPNTGVLSDWVLCASPSGEWPLADLNEKDSEILDGQDPGTYEVTYHLTEADALANLNPLVASAYRLNVEQQTIYSRITHRDFPACFNTTEFRMVVNALPQPDLRETYVICPDSPDLSIDGGDFNSWRWQDESGNILSTDRIWDISATGKFSLNVTEERNGVVCENTTSFEVVSSGAPETLTYELGGLSDRIDLVIIATGIGEFE
jgi:PKD repeat protein